MKVKTNLCLLVILCLALVISCKRDDHLVTALPDYPESMLKSKWYSGFYPVGTYKHLHYIFVESLHKPETDPVLVWFNGGPGASSIWQAFMALSPVISIDNTDKLKEWDYSFCKNASVLFIDNPAGVGYSYGKREKIDLATSDVSFRIDILSFMRQFYADFNEFIANPLFIMGISYGGYYAPATTYALHVFNQELALNHSAGISLDTKPFNLKGFLAANGITDIETDPLISTVEMAYHYGWVSHSWYKSYRENKCKVYWQNVKPNYLPGPCPELLKKAEEVMKLWDIYAVDTAPPVPLDGPKLKNAKSYGKAIVNGTERVYRRDGMQGQQLRDLMIQREDDTLMRSILSSVETPDKEGQATLSDYFNREDVRKAFHVPPEVPSYIFISDSVFEQYITGREGSAWIYDVLYKYDYRMVHLMGDTDGILSLPGAWLWIKDRKFPVTKPWTPYIIESETNSQLIGYLKEYGNGKFSLVTIHGKGHGALSAPSDPFIINPLIIDNFINGKPLYPV